MFFWLMPLLGLLTSSASGQAAEAASLQRGDEIATLQGVLLSHDGKPVFGAFLYLDPPEGELPQHTCDWQTDRPDGYSRPNGRFIIRKPPGNYRLTVWIGNRRVHVLPVTLEAKKEQTLEVRLPKLPTLSGKVVDSEGNPVSEVVVVLIPSGEQERRTAFPSPKGEFVFIMPPSGKVTIAVSTQAFEELLKQEINLSGDRDQEVVLQLPSMPRLTIRLLKRDGKPLANAPVSVAVGFSTSERTTDGNGCIRLLQSLLPSEGFVRKILIRAKGEGWAIVAPEPYRTISRTVPVRLQPFGSISGQVVTPDGKPLNDVQVSVQPVTPNPFSHISLEQRANTDKQGRFKVGELWAGNYRVSLEGERYQTFGFGEIIWLAPGQHKTVTLIAPPSQQKVKQATMATITGQVLDAEGKPVAEATVQLNKQLPSPWGFMEVQPSEPVKTDEAGKFTITGVKPGWHVLSARTKEGIDAVQWVYVPPPENGKPAQISVTLQLPQKFGAIKGTVLKDGGKTPAVGVGIMAIESHYYLVNYWGTEDAALNLQVRDDQTICVGGG